MLVAFGNDTIEFTWSKIHDIGNFYPVTLLDSFVDAFVQGIGMLPKYERLVIEGFEQPMIVSAFPFSWEIF